MKVKTITRSGETHSRERKGDIFKVPRNTDPNQHPFERAREYVRAVNAAKLDRMFAKPFVGALSGHVDGIYCMNRHSTDLKIIGSGAGDGELRLWNLATKRCIWRRERAHDAFIRGIAFIPNSNLLLSCGDDKVVRMWDYVAKGSTPDGDYGSGVLDEIHDNAILGGNQPVGIFQGRGTLTGIDTHHDGLHFATSGSQEVALWDRNRAEPLQTFSWGADTVNCIKFNQAEAALLASCATDRSLMLHDTRTVKTIAKVILKMKSNAVAWNPQEAVYLSVANEDHHVYTFDMRYFDRAVNVQAGHVSAVLDLDYSPTGQELVTAGYDRTMRIFNIRQGHSRDIYHTMRMQRLFCVKYSMDSNYVLSGSDDGNVRIWKAHASQQLGVKNYRQQAALDYNSAVLGRFNSLPEVKRIANHRILPKEVRLAARQGHDHRLSQKRKHENVKRHSKPGTVTDKNLRDDAILQVKD